MGSGGGDPLILTRSFRRSKLPAARSLFQDIRAPLTSLVGGRVVLTVSMDLVIYVNNLLMPQSEGKFRGFHVKLYCSIPKSPHLLQGPLTSGCREFFPRGLSGRCVKMTDHLYLVPRLRISRAASPSPLCFHHLYRDNFITPTPPKSSGIRSYQYFSAIYYFCLHSYHYNSSPCLDFSLRISKRLMRRIFEYLCRLHKMISQK